MRPAAKGNAKLKGRWEEVVIRLGGFCWVFFFWREGLVGADCICYQHSADDTPATNKMTLCLNEIMSAY